MKALQENAHQFHDVEDLLSQNKDGTDTVEQPKDKEHTSGPHSFASANLNEDSSQDLGKADIRCVNNIEARPTIPGMLRTEAMIRYGGMAAPSPWSYIRLNRSITTINKRTPLRACTVGKNILE
jgi:hypothetical protein